MGVKGAYDYLKRRLRAVEADRKAAEEAFEEARDSGSDEDELSNAAQQCLGGLS